MLRSTPFASSLVSILVLTASMGVLGTGCTATGLVSTDYASDEDVTEYETKPISIPGMQWGSGYGSSTSLEVWARGECRGQNCTPDRVTLIFQLSGSGSMRMQNQAVELRAGGQTYGSSGRGGMTGRGIDDLASAVGVIATMQVPFEDFRTIAEADQLSGSVGTSTFRLSQRKRAPFQALVQKVTAPTEPETSENSS